MKADSHNQVHANTDTTPFDWQTQPEAATLIAQFVDDACARCRPAARLRRRLLEAAGTRLVDCLDHLLLRADIPTDRLQSAGFVSRTDTAENIWDHPGGMFPAIRLTNGQPGLAVKVDSVTDFCVAYRVSESVDVEGAPLASLRRAKLASENGASLWIIERHGSRDFEARDLPAQQALALLRHQDALRRRPRDFENRQAGFGHAMRLIGAAKQDLGVDRTCDLFFAAEREVWQSRNRAGRIQKARQDTLGIGWANHDHHTFRSSRAHFATLIAALEALGFVCRERFYAGADALWGAQVLEQPQCGILVFADVDLSADEVVDDFAHAGLEPADTLGTIGLWCALHGESFLQAGLHHLECQFDFDAVRSQLAEEGIETMAPFTDFPHLKQAFTKGQMWPVAGDRLEAARSAGHITDFQADEFTAHSALGSHLEILERNDGYKGFNQTGISDIIRKTDLRLPR